MTVEQALIHYNDLTSNEEAKPLRHKAHLAINALVEISKMVENAGGTLRSRQVMASIIYFSENPPDQAGI